MSMLTVSPTADTIVELEADRFYYLVTVDWEYEQARYVLVSDRADAIRADFTHVFLALPRDEGFVITDVHLL